MCFSVAGLIEENGVPPPARNSPPMNSPYSLRRLRIAWDSGAGAYSRNVIGGPQSIVT